MQKPRFSLGPFRRRLQWRLTLSYTLVTVAALVVVELALVGILLIFINSDSMTREIVETIRLGFVPRARDFLDNTPPDVEGLSLWLETAVGDSVTVAGDGRRLTRGLSIEFDQDYQIFVIDAAGRLLTQVSEGHNSAPLGAPFETTTVPQSAPLLSAALSGDAVERPYIIRSDGTLVAVLPIDSKDGVLLGAFIITIHLPTFSLQTFGSFAILILISVIPCTLAAGLVGAVFGFLTSRGFTRRIESLSSTADAWSQGDFSVMTTDKSADELGQLSHRLNLMAEQLQNLLQTHQELAALKERNRLARDLHDSVKQQVFATSMQVGAAKALLSTDPEAATKHLEEAEQLARGSQQELAGLIEELRPAALESDGLVKAIHTYTATWSRHSEIEATVTVQDEWPLPLPVEQALFRVAQEALSNIARHSRADRADINLSWQTNAVILTIIDDGRGFDPSDSESYGFGLQSMRDRIEALGGRLLVESRPGEGVRVQAQVKVDDP